MRYDHEYIRNIRQELEKPELEGSIIASDHGCLSLAIVSDQQDAERLVAELESQDPDSGWGFREWIEEAMLYPGFVVSCREAADSRAVGFMSFDTLVFIHGLEGGAGSKASISVKLEPKTVYVTEAARGRGPGQAFIDVLADQVPAVLQRLAVMSGGSLRDLPVREVTVGMESECVSDEGARFIRKAYEACSRRLEGIDRAGPWKVSSQLLDHIDYGDFNEDADEDIGAVLRP
jgi:hypothetical protein